MRIVLEPRLGQIFLRKADGQLDDVGGGALDGGVNCGALGHGPQKRNSGINIGEISAPAEEGLSIVMGGGKIFDVRQVLFQPSKLLKIIVVKFLGFWPSPCPPRTW